MNTDIDFVIPWVDGSDPAWNKERNKWRTKETGVTLPEWNDDVSRYRDWGLLKYWFRGVEEFAPWVRKVFFITCNQIPDWLNTNDSRLVCIDHKDYIPSQYLPTFSSHCIELNMHRISGLSEHFVYFNDDTFITRPVKPEDFFYKGLPKDAAIMKPVRMQQNGIRAEINNLYAINEKFSMAKSVFSNPTKWINPIYGPKLFSTFLMLPYNIFSGFYICHLPQAYLKGTYDDIWKTYPEILDRTCQHRFRDVTDVNQWLAQYWQFATGRFEPRSPRIGKTYEGVDQFDQMCEAVRAQKYKLICCNDSVDIDDYDKRKRQINDSFERILGKKSGFEK